MSIELKGRDAEIFLENLDKELTQEDINEIRAWACAPKVKEIEAQLNKNEKLQMIPDICKSKPQIVDRTQLIMECVDCEIAASCQYKKEKERQLWGKTPAEKIISIIYRN